MEVGGVNTKITTRNGLSNDSKLCTDIVLTLIKPKYLVSSRQIFLVTYNPLKYITKNVINQEALYMNEDNPMRNVPHVICMSHVFY